MSCFPCKFINTYSYTSVLHIERTIKVKISTCTNYYYQCCEWVPYSGNYKQLTEQQQSRQPAQTIQIAKHHLITILVIYVSTGVAWWELLGQGYRGQQLRDTNISLHFQYVITGQAVYFHSQSSMFCNKITLIFLNLNKQ